jgi:hypothetical protein
MWCVSRAGLGKPQPGLVSARMAVARGGVEEGVWDWRHPSINKGRCPGGKGTRQSRCSVTGNGLSWPGLAVKKCDEGMSAYATVRVRWILCHDQVIVLWPGIARKAPEPAKKGGPHPYR